MLSGNSVKFSLYILMFLATEAFELILSKQKNNLIERNPFPVQRKITEISD